MLTDAWPLFGLELRTQRLALRVPRDEDFPGLLDAIDAGIHPPERMPFTQPWTDVEPVARRRSALQFWWRCRGEWTVQSWNLLFVVLADDRPVGVQELLARDFPRLRETGTGSWLTEAAQGQRYGTEMRTAVLDLAFHRLGAVRSRSGAFTDNSASLAVSRSLGYRTNGTRFEAPRGEPREVVDVVVDRGDWLARGPGTTTITGLEPCLPMFGLPAPSERSLPGDGPG